MRKSLILLAAVSFPLAGCVGGGYGGGSYGDPYASRGSVSPANQPLNSAAVRTLGGAALGAVVADATGGSKTKGALLGAAAGAVAGTMLGQHNTGSSGGSNRNQCYYADGRGGTYIANC